MLAHLMNVAISMRVSRILGATPASGTWRPTSYILNNAWVLLCRSILRSWAACCCVRTVPSSSQATITRSSRWSGTWREGGGWWLEGGTAASKHWDMQHQLCGLGVQLLIRNATVAVSKTVLFELQIVRDLILAVSSSSWAGSGATRPSDWSSSSSSSSSAWTLDAGQLPKEGGGVVSGAPRLVRSLSVDRRCRTPGRHPPRPALRFLLFYI